MPNALRFRGSGVIQPRLATHLAKLAGLSEVRIDDVPNELAVKLSLPVIGTVDAHARLDVIGEVAQLRVLHASKSLGPFKVAQIEHDALIKFPPVRKLEERHPVPGLLWLKIEAL